MLQVGYLSLDSPVALISPQDEDSSTDAGLVILGGFDLDQSSPEEICELLTSKNLSGRAGSLSDQTPWI